MSSQPQGESSEVDRKTVSHVSSTVTRHDDTGHPATSRRTEPLLEEHNKKCALFLSFLVDSNAQTDAECFVCLLHFVLTHMHGFVIEAVPLTSDAGVNPLPDGWKIASSAGFFRLNYLHNDNKGSCGVDEIKRLELTFVFSGSGVEKLSNVTEGWFSPLAQLPTELCLAILSSCVPPVKSVLALSQTCCHFKALCDRPDLWKEILGKVYGESATAEAESEVFNSDYKACYQARYQDDRREARERERRERAFIRMRDTSPPNLLPSGHLRHPDAHHRPPPDPLAIPGILGGDHDLYPFVPGRMGGVPNMRPRYDPPFPIDPDVGLEDPFSPLGRGRPGGRGRRRGIDDLPGGGFPRFF